MKVLGLFLCLLIVTQSVQAGLYDPMQPPPYALDKFRLEKLKKNRPVTGSKKTPEKKTAWVLSSILYSTQRKHAIINNKLVKKGDIINGARLVRLRPDSVRLNLKGKSIDLKLPGRMMSMKKPLAEK